jgi:chromosome segregation ATPase
VAAGGDGAHGSPNSLAVSSDSEEYGDAADLRRHLRDLQEGHARLVRERDDVTRQRDEATDRAADVGRQHETLRQEHLQLQQERDQLEDETRTLKDSIEEAEKLNKELADQKGLVEARLRQSEEDRDREREQAEVRLCHACDAC